MAMTVKGGDDGRLLRICVHLDDTKVIPDPTFPAPQEGEEDTRPLVPDVNWCLFLEWGKEPPEGRTMDEYLADIRRDALGLGEEELRRRQPPVEVDLSL